MRQGDICSQNQHFIPYGFININVPWDQLSLHLTTVVAIQHILNMILFAVIIRA